MYADRDDPAASWMKGSSIRSTSSTSCQKASMRPADTTSLRYLLSSPGLPNGDTWGSLTTR
jgi:hypothetical protein